MHSIIEHDEQIHARMEARAWRLRRQSLLYLVYAIGLVAFWPMYGICGILFLLALACVWSFS